MHHREERTGRLRHGNIDGGNRRHGLVAAEAAHLLDVADDPDDPSRGVAEREMAADGFLAREIQAGERLVHDHHVLAVGAIGRRDASALSPHVKDVEVVGRDVRQVRDQPLAVGFGSIEAAGARV